ncbi:caspase-8 [Battus philenor]|uniref:caspase-8 n=1 Tax=Battus philenor TaxID=42288 RepID=UPI0035CF69C0
MLQSDARKQQKEYFGDKMCTINLEVIQEVQKDIDSYDMISLVFLLYEVPDTALQRLLVHQRICKDSDMNLLYDWALNAQSRPTWKYEFIEALTICRLYNVIRKLGFDVSNVKDHYLPNNINVSVYVNLIKKALYKLCENMKSDNLQRLKKSLLTYDIDTSEYESCELILLDLMSHKFITVGQSNIHGKSVLENKCQVETLIKIIENMPGLKKIAVEIKNVANIINNETSSYPSQLDSTPGVSKKDNDKPKLEDKFDESFVDIFQMLETLNKQDPPTLNLKSDTKQITRDAYPIKNKERIGVCCIINQEEFHPSKDSIESESQTHTLENRLGSTIDQLSLERTMSSLNFKIRSCCNVGHREMIQFIKDVIHNDVCPDDSVFMLCILSHGIRGHVYAADSVKVKVEDIQNLLDSNEARCLRGIPKVLILQACQVDEHRYTTHLVADGPSENYFLKKSDFLIYWATAPENEAYRDEQKGSIFIQSLCYSIGRKAKEEHLYDIFTKVTNIVSHICNKLQRAQVPIFESTLRKKLFLHIPELT